MRKFLTVLFALLMTFSMLAFSACGEKEPLILKEDILYTSRNNWHPISNLLDLELNNISESDVKITCDDNLIYFEDGRLYIRNELGNSSCTITAKNKSAKLEIKILTRLEVHEKLYGNGKVYLATKSLINCLDNFKNPSSVEVVNCWAFSNDDGGYEYFIYEIRAENGFGGMAIDIFKIDADGYSISYADRPFGQYDTIVAGVTINEIIKDYFEK